MKTVNFTEMKNGTKEDYELLEKFEKNFERQTAERVLNYLSKQTATLEGYKITRLEHSLQAATRAYKNGESEEMVVATLLHDIGDDLAPMNHSQYAASILRPYVSEKVYWICPLLEMSEKLDMTALQKRYEILSKIFESYNPVLAHGKMSKEDREESINNFFSSKSKMLVASTVIEVGIDIPDATIIIIENSERFGLAQLHQLRGRVGRGSKQSYCILMYNKNISEIGKSRLETLRNSNDGFYIAEQDLKLRGPGEIFGTKQSGEETFRLFSLKDTELLITAKSIAQEIVSNEELSFKHEVLMNIFNKDDYIQNLN